MIEEIAGWAVIVTIIVAITGMIVGYVELFRQK